MTNFRGRNAVLVICQNDGQNKSFFAALNLKVILEHHASISKLILRKLSVIFLSYNNKQYHPFARILRSANLIFFNPLLSILYVLLLPTGGGIVIPLNILLTMLQC